MKNGMLILLALFFIVACDDDDNNNSNSKVTEVKNAAINGQWQVTYFFDTDETENFKDYVFEFGSDGTLTATKGSTSVFGAWSVTDDGNDDNSKGDYDDIDFNISFATPHDFEELTEDWEIIAMTSTKIELRHVSGGGGGTDLLTFEKV